MFQQAQYFTIALQHVSRPLDGTESFSPKNTILLQVVSISPCLFIFRINVVCPYPFHSVDDPLMNLRYALVEREVLHNVCLGLVDFDRIS